VPFPAAKIGAAGHEYRETLVFAPTQPTLRPMTPRALITGITGQDARYLADLLLENGYDVHGLLRPAPGTEAGSRFWRLEGILDRITLHEADLSDATALEAVLRSVEPPEVFHFAALSSVSASFRDPLATYRSNVEGTQNLFGAIRDVVPHARTYFAASCEMFGVVDHNPANEDTPFRPISPYGTAKLAGYRIANQFRDAHGSAITCGIAFNHDSPLRGPEFVTTKIARAAARIAAGQTDRLRIGNLDVRRDWGYAPEFVRAMWLLMKHEPGDFVVATGRSESLENLLAAAFDEVGLDWQRYTEQDPALARPADIRELYGDPSRLRAAVGWTAATSGQAVIRLMVRHEVQKLSGAVTS
jgi:GDPmannose 4,6-dehydratase